MSPGDVVALLWPLAVLFAIVAYGVAAIVRNGWDHRERSERWGDDWHRDEWIGR